MLSGYLLRLSPIQYWIPRTSKRFENNVPSVHIILTPDLVLEPEGDVVAEDDPIAELQGRGLPGDADTVRRERVTLDKLRSSSRNWNRYVFFSFRKC